MTHARTVLISGASIAGPTLAYWLRRRGFVPTIVERALAPRPGGQAIDVRGKAIDVVRGMGLLEAVESLRTRMTGMSVQDAEGNEISRTNERTFSGGRFAAGDIEVLRDDLATALMGRLTDVEIIYGDTITGLAEGPDDIGVEFRRTPPCRFDLVIAADGLHSNVRRLAYGDDTKFLISLGAGLAVFSVPNDLGLTDWQIAFRDEARGAGYVIYTARDNSELRVCIGFAATLADTRKGDIFAQKKLVAERTAGWGWKIPHFIDGMWNARDFYFGAMAQTHIQCLSRGRITLVGDAGYCPSPFSGQGTSLAIVGAYVLAEELGRAPDNHEAAYLRYEKRMRPYIRLNQALATRDRSMPQAEADRLLDEAKNAIELTI